MINALRRFAGQDRGSVAIEAALVLPVVLVMVGGIMDYSRVLLAQHQVRDIIDEAARTGALKDQSESFVQDEVEAAIAAVPGLSNTAVSVDKGTSLTISVTGDVDLVFGALLPSEVVTFTFNTKY